MDMTTALEISARGMTAQTARLRVIAENLANQDTTGSTPGSAAYRRKTVTFENRLDRALGAQTVQVRKVAPDPSDLPLRYDPSNPAANAQGYVQTSNVNTFVELMDMREAQRSYSANLATMSATRSMLNRAIELLK